MRDTAALAAALPGAVMLGWCHQGTLLLPPVLCNHLHAWQLPCVRLDAHQSLAARDRDMLLDLLAESGLSAFLWAGLRFAVVHLLVPGQERCVAGEALRVGHASPDFLPDEEPCPMKGPWEDARAFWYELATEDAHVRI
jgi:hypothetical protein